VALIDVEEDFTPVLKGNYPVDSLSLKVELLCCFKKSRIISPVTQCHFAEDLNSGSHHCENSGPVPNIIMLFNC